MMESERCKWCGSADCGTNQSQVYGDIRSEKCYKVELAHLRWQLEHDAIHREGDAASFKAELAKWKGLVREAVEFVQDRASNYWESGNPDKTKGKFFCDECYAEKGKPHWKESCGVGRAERFLDNPEIKALVEGKEGG